MRKIYWNRLLVDSRRQQELRGQTHRKMGTQSHRPTAHCRHGSGVTNVSSKVIIVVSWPSPNWSRGVMLNESRKKSSNSFPLIRGAILGTLAAAVLSACGGGADT